MKTSLQTRLIVTYALVALVSIVSVSLSANLFLETQFSHYVQHKIKLDQEQTLKTLADAYSSNSAWNYDELSVIGMNALGRGFIIRVDDNFNQIVWDARTHNNGMCQQMLATMARNMDSRYHSWNGSYQEHSFGVNVSGVRVGTAWIGFYGPFYYNDSEIYFLDSLNQIVLLVALLALIVAIVLGIFMARSISNPLRKVTATAHSLRFGAFDSRAGLSSSISEIADLSASIKSLAQTLGEQEFLRRRLTIDVSHELRTPLTTLQGHLEAMIDGIWPADARRLESCREEVLRLSRLVGQIEGLAKVEADQVLLELQPVDLHRWIAQVCTNFQAEFAARQVALDWACQDIITLADPDKLTQILINLLSNALKYTPNGGQVQVDITKEFARDGNLDSPFVCIRVADSGIGIPSADLSRVFERFYRVDASRTRGTGGAGIGLTIAMSLAVLHGGTIKVESDLGKGSTFLVMIPFRQTSQGSL